MHRLVLVILVACGDAKPVAEPQVPISAPVTVIDAAPAATCFCFSWVHLDENGQSCFTDRPTCDAEFKAFGRHMKRPCEVETNRCESYACRDLGKECFTL